MRLEKRECCFACQSRTRHDIGQIDRAVFVECSRCGALWLEGEAGHDDSSWSYDPSPPPHLVAYYNGRAERFASYLAKIHPQTGTLLDIGCGHGEFMQAAARLGWQVSGNELNPDQACQTMDLTGLHVYPGDLSALAATLDRRFDVITLWGVLEHVPDPAGLLVTVRKLLAPGGTVLLETPNAAGLFFTIARMLYHGRFTRPLREMTGGDHVIWITPKAASFLFRHTGFNLIGLDGSTNSTDHLRIRFNGEVGVKGVAYREGVTALNTLAPMVNKANQLLVSGRAV